jgi:hypothetical protein
VRELPSELKAWIVSTLARGDVDTVEMCNFVTRFCQTAGFPCDDNIYKAAMGVFGWTPGHGNTPAEAFPGRFSPFSTWRSFFVALCDAYRTDSSAVPNDLWLTLDKMPDTVREVDGDLWYGIAERTHADNFVVGMKEMMRAEDAPLRFLDQFLIMLYKWIGKHSRTARMGRSAEIEYDIEGALQAWSRGGDLRGNVFSAEDTAAVAMFIVLWMRGARMNSEWYYVENFDEPMYKAIVDAIQGQRDWEGVHTQAEAFVEVGGNADYAPHNRNTYPGTPGPSAALAARAADIFRDNSNRSAMHAADGDVPTLFELALISRRTVLVLLLLEKGYANISAGHGEGANYGQQVMNILSTGGLRGGAQSLRKKAYHLIGEQILSNAELENQHENAANAVRFFVESCVDVRDRLAKLAFQRLLVALENPWRGSSSDEGD